MVFKWILEKIAHRMKRLKRYFTANQPKVPSPTGMKTIRCIVIKTPSYIIKMNSEDRLCWYHRNLDRKNAEDLLKNSGISDGVFLVRDSNTSPGDYVLSVLHKDEVFHYQIRRHGEDAFFSIDDQTPIHGLDALIDHYRVESSGLVTQLSEIIRRDPPPAESRKSGFSNLLHRATKNGSLKVVGPMLDNPEKKYSLDAKDEDGRSAVHLACIVDKNAEAILEKLINAGANVNCRDQEGNSPLHYACRSKSLSLIKLLVKVQAQIDARNNGTGRVPLHEAASNGNLEVVKYLLELKVPHLPRSANDETPAQLARKAGHFATADFLENYVPPTPTTEKSQWCHGTLNRNDSEKILRKHAELNIDNYEDKDASGTFLIRLSDRENKYVLGLLNKNDECKHYVIKYSAHHFLYIDEGPYMPSLEHLVAHYMLFTDGLPNKLRYPVKPSDKPPLPPALQLQPQTPPKFSKERKLSKDIDSSTPPQIKERNLSLPSDDLMNQVGLSSPKHSHTDSLPATNKKKSSRKLSGDISFFSLKRINKKTSNIFDGLHSLKIPKKDSKLKSKEFNESIDSTTNLMGEDSISQSMKSLNFSTNFVENEAIYNIPNNIPANRTEDALNHNLLLTPERRSATCSRTNDVGDVDLFTRSDNIASLEGIEDKDNAIEEIYFVEAPTKSTPFTSEFQNYVALKQTPYFPHANRAETDTENNNVPAHVPASRATNALSIQSTTDIELMLALEHTSNNATASPENIQSISNPIYYISASSIILNEVLGTGEFGSVHKGFMRCDVKNGQSQDVPVAIKTLLDEHCKENRIEFLREATVMIKLSHHCIVKMIGISKGPPLMIIQELVSLGSLLNYLEENATKIRPKFELKIWASQIACGMNYLESQHFVHRDLAARNILLASVHQAKISDFGLSRALCAGDNYYQTSRGGKWPIKWYAPESCNYGTFSHASDVWSFGVTLWEMYSFGQPPYDDKTGADVIKWVENGNRLPKPDACPENVYDIISSCWNYSPKNRPTFRFLTEFFSNDPDYQNLIELIKTQNIL